MSLAESTMQDRLEARFPGLMNAACEIGDGWEQLITDMFVELWNLGPPGLVIVTTLKEKFQLLRVYFEAPEYLYTQVVSIVTKYETKSANVCFVCGKPGFIEHKTHWGPPALCNICRNKNGKKEE